MSGPPPKTAARRQRRNKANVVSLRVLEGGRQELALPNPPAWLSTKNADFWRQYWSSDLALAADPKTDIQAIHRLFGLYDERDRLEKAYKAKPLIKGSMGQMRLNPLRGLISGCDAEILKLEDRFGLNPISRLRLGITFGEAAKTMADLNNMLNDDGSDNGTEKEIDPREA